MRREASSVDGDWLIVDGGMHLANFGLINCGLSGTAIAVGAWRYGQKISGFDLFSCGYLSGRPCGNNLANSSVQ